MTTTSARRIGRHLFRLPSLLANIPESNTSNGKSNGRSTVIWCGRHPSAFTECPAGETIAEPVVVIVTVAVAFPSSVRLGGEILQFAPGGAPVHVNEMGSSKPFIEDKVSETVAVCPGETVSIPGIPENSKS